MDSSTVGIPRNSPGGYYQRVAWSVRISNSGEFVRRPLVDRVPGPGQRLPRLRHLSTANAAWFYRLTRRGDVVEVRARPRPGTSFGVADWNMSWPAGSPAAPCRADRGPEGQELRSWQRSTTLR